MAHDWSDFDRFETKYMPRMGDGDTMASQAETALNKIVFKWYNDGDVYDNQHGMAGWANDIESIERFMRKNCGLYFKTVKELADYLFTE